MKNNDLANNRENASYRVLQDGVSRGKSALPKQLYSQEVQESHFQGYIHIHDIEYSNVSYNCLGINSSERIEEYVQSSKEELYLEDILTYLLNDTIKLTNEQSGGIGVLNLDHDLQNCVGNIEIKELVKCFRRFFDILNSELRKGTEKPYITYNLGLNTSANGRKVTEAALIAYQKGKRGSLSPFIFPNIVFKLKKGVNKTPKDPNYDLFQLAMKVSGARMNPTYFNCDSPFVKEIDPNKIGIMGCRTLLGKNRHGADGGEARGNVAAATINLPKISQISKNENDFFNNLNRYLEITKESLLTRFSLLKALPKKNFNYISKNRLYLGSEKENIEEMFKNGTFSIGFMGLFDSVSKLKKSEVSKEFLKGNLDFAEKILAFMKDKVDTYSQEEDLNFSLLATSGEGISGKFSLKDEEHEYYTNSFHVPVYIDISPFEKLDIESRFSKYCSGGSITYIELSAPIFNNYKAIEDIINYGLEKNITYLGVNFPLDYCRECGEIGVFEKDICIKCSGKEIKSIRRVSGYLSEKNTLKQGKKQEEASRKKHL